MKKLIIFSFVLISILGLFAQSGPGVPYSIIFDLETATGDYHAESEFGFKACQYNENNGGELWETPYNALYWNWPSDTDANTGTTVYDEASGQLIVQMASFTEWGVFGTLARFWFTDIYGNEYGPIDIEKIGADYQYHPDVIAWGGPPQLTAPDAWATLVAPADGAEDVPIDTALEWTYEGSVEPDGFVVVLNGETIDVVYTLNFPHNLSYNTFYTWSVKPYVYTSPSKGMKATRNYLFTEGEAPEWTFTTEAYTTNVGDVEVVIDAPPGITPNPPVEVVVETGEQIGDILVPGGLVSFRATIDQAPGTYTFSFNLGYPAAVVLINGVILDTYTYTDGILTFTWEFTDAKDAIDLFVYDPGTLPVELASFTAIAHASEYVVLKWVTESESNLQGYNIYRAENDNISLATRINPTLVQANNEAITHTYSYTDSEVEATTYYYWLEVSELSNENEFHGPIIVKVEDDPDIPSITETVFRNFGPTPFTESTTTSLRVKEGETASIVIYNLLGQVVKKETFNSGEHNFVFDGRDLNNKRVANGIYFVRMSSPTAVKNFKIVKMK